MWALHGSAGRQTGHSPTGPMLARPSLWKRRGSVGKCPHHLRLATCWAKIFPSPPPLTPLELHNPNANSNENSWREREREMPCLSVWRIKWLSRVIKESLPWKEGNALMFQPQLLPFLRERESLCFTSCRDPPDRLSAVYHQSSLTYMFQHIPRVVDWRGMQLIGI